MLMHYELYDKLFVSTASVLSREKIVSLSEMQKNPAKALDGDIVRIVKNGKVIGIFMSKEQFEDFIEEIAALKPSFKAELDSVIKKGKKLKTAQFSL